MRFECRGRGGVQYLEAEFVRLQQQFAHARGDGVGVALVGGRLRGRRAAHDLARVQHHAVAQAHEAGEDGAALRHVGGRRRTRKTGGQHARPLRRLQRRLALAGEHVLRLAAERVHHVPLGVALGLLVDHLQLLELPLELVLYPLQLVARYLPVRQTGVGVSRG